MDLRILAVSSALLAVLAGCGGEEAGSRECKERVEIEFVTWKEGDYALQVTMGDRAFSCSLYSFIENIGENPEDFHFGGTCEGARLEGGRLVIDGPPATIVWSVTWTDPTDATARETRTGQVDPVFHADGACQVAGAYLPSW